MSLRPPPGTSSEATSQKCQPVATARGKDRHDRKPDPRLGQILSGRYLLEEEIGHGGVATVFASTNQENGQRVAVKLLHEWCNGDQEIIRRLLAEAEATRGLNHPNLVRSSEAHCSDGMAYYVMELLEGCDLAVLLHRERRIEVERAARIISEAAKGVAELHRNGIIHRDIKPANIFIVVNGQEESIKIIDLGISKFCSGQRKRRVSENSRNAEGNFEKGYGTMAYAAPEQIMGMAHSHLADIYSLGVTLYEMICGSLPFSYKNIGKTILEKKSGAPEAPGKRCPELRIPEAMDAIILRAMANRPEDRFQSAEELRDALTEMLERASG